jgi:uncharacterized damage-inducible protein DinB
MAHYIAMVFGDRPNRRILHRKPVVLADIQRTDADLTFMNSAMKWQLHARRPVSPAESALETERTLDMEDPLIETWAIHNRINLYLLDAIPDKAMTATPSPKKCRTVHRLFAHIHNVRLLWLKAAAPELLEGLEKIETKTVGTKAKLRAALEASGRAVEQLLRKGIAADGKIKRFQPHATAFLGYLISHESHHRGQAGWALKLSGHPLDQKTAYGLWEWGAR